MQKRKFIQLKLILIITPIIIHGSDIQHRNFQ